MVTNYKRITYNTDTKMCTAYILFCSRMSVNYMISCAFLVDTALYLFLFFRLLQAILKM